MSRRFNPKSGQWEDSGQMQIYEFISKPTDTEEEYSECPICGLPMIENPNNGDIECECI